MVNQEQHLCDVADCCPSPVVLETVQYIQEGDRLNEESRHGVSAHIHLCFSMRLHSSNHRYLHAKLPRPIQCG